MNRTATLVLAAILLLTVAVVSSAGERPADVVAVEKEKALELVENAIDLIEEKGLEDAVDELNDPNGEFIDGEIYIAVMNFTGLMYANPGAPFLKGKQLPMTSTDAKGNPLRMIEIAQEEGEGWFDYYWTHSGKKKVLLKSAYIKRIPGVDAYVSCGVWLED
jgi:signal transduction histidine kinase